MAKPKTTTVADTATARPFGFMSKQGELQNVPFKQLVAVLGKNQITAEELLDGSDKVTARWKMMDADGKVEAAIWLFHGQDPKKATNWSIWGDRKALQIVAKKLEAQHGNEEARLVFDHAETTTPTPAAKQETAHTATGATAKQVEKKVEVKKVEAKKEVAKPEPVKAEKAASTPKRFPTNPEAHDAEFRAILTELGMPTAEVKYGKGTVAIKTKPEGAATRNLLTLNDIYLTADGAMFMTLNLNSVAAKNTKLPEGVTGKEHAGYMMLKNQTLLEIAEIVKLNIVVKAPTKKAKK